MHVVSCCCVWARLISCVLCAFVLFFLVFFDFAGRASVCARASLFLSVRICPYACSLRVSWCKSNARGCLHEAVHPHVCVLHVGPGLCQGREPACRMLPLCAHFRRLLWKVQTHELNQ